MGRSTQIVKAIAQQRGWRHFSHQDIMRAVDALRRETGDSELALLFGSAGYLHVNFYENGYTGDTIEDYLHQVERFVDKAEGILGETP